MNAIAKLEALNAYRATEGKAPYGDWRAARHQPMLDAYDAAAQKAIAAVREAINSHDFADKAIEDAVKAAKIPPYKTFARYAASAVDKPCAFVHQFLNDHPTLTRKQAMHALMQYGINYSTARTQYQKWFANRPAAEFTARNAATNAPDEG